MKDDQHERDYQDDVDRCGRDVEGEEAEQPQGHQDQGDAGRVPPEEADEE
jgi:hypothetical protein